MKGYYDRYAIDSAKCFSYDVCKTPRGMVLVNQRTGEIKDPLGVGMDTARRAAIDQSSFYRIARDAIRDLLKGEVRKIELDRQVQEILDSEPFASQRRQRAEDMVLFQRAMMYADHLNHKYWEIKNFSERGVPEPALGDPDCQDSWEQWLATHRANKQREAVLTIPDMFEAFKPVWSPPPGRLSGWRKGDKLGRQKK